MRRFERILVPLDLAKKHLGAVDVATDLVADGGRVILVHAVELIPGLPEDEANGFYERIEREVRRHLEAEKARVEEGGVECHAEIRFGDRTREILAFAEEAGVDLVVLSSHRVDPENPAAGMGTLSYKIGILAQCPVLLVK